MGLKAGSTPCIYMTRSHTIIGNNICYYHNLHVAFVKRGRDTSTISVWTVGLYAMTHIVVAFQMQSFDAKSSADGKYGLHNSYRNPY